MEHKKIKIIIVTGPTATGKTRLTVQLAKVFNGEIISADSRQVYRGLDIGTGKDILEYGDIPRHLTDIVDPIEEYNLLRFRNEVPDIIMEINGRGKLPFIAGGSVLYIDSILSEYDMPGGGPSTEIRSSVRTMEESELAGRLAGSFGKKIDLRNRNRVARVVEKSLSTGYAANPFPFRPEYLLLGTYYERKQVHARIEARLDSRLNSGMVEEVSRLHENGVSWDRLEFLGLEYRYIAYYLQKKLTFDEMRRKLLEKIRQFAKRQDIWFRKLEREGHQIHWIRNGDFNKASRLVELFLKGGELPPPELNISSIYYGKKTS